MNSVTDNTKISSENTSLVSAKSQVTFIYSSEVALQKVWKLDGNLKLDFDDPKFPMYCRTQRHSFEGVKGLFKTLTSIQTEFNPKVPHPENWAVMRGYWPDDATLAEMEKVRASDCAAVNAAGGKPRNNIKLPYFYEEKSEGKTPKRFYRRLKSILLEQPLDWVCIDFDKVEVPELGAFDVANPQPWVDAAIASELGPGFDLANYVLDLSSSAGLKTGVSAHVWFMLEKPMDRYMWEAWVLHRTSVLGRKPKIDASMFQKERIHFTAPPKFKNDIKDPVQEAGGKRWHLIEKMEERVYFGDWAAIEATSVALRDEANRKEISRELNLNEEEEAKSAFNRPGVAGAFNRCFSMSETINKFLPDEFRIDTPEGRVTWLNSNSGAREGCKIVAGNTRMFNTHSGDPFEGKPCHAFDHIIEYVYDGDFGAAAEWAKSIPAVVEEMERAELAVFDEAPSPSWNSEIALKASAYDEEPFTDIFETKAPTPAASGEVLTPDQMMAEYPMPLKWGGSDAFYRLMDGQWWYGFLKNVSDGGDELGPPSKKKGKEFTKLWSPVTFNWLMCVETENITLQIKFHSPTGEPKYKTISRDEIIEEKKLGKLLLGFGWLCDANGLAALQAYIKRVKPVIQNQARRRGWIKYRGHDIFAAPNGEVIGAPHGLTIKLAQEQTFKPDNARAGTLEGWRAAIEAVCAAPGHQNNALGLVAGLVGALPPGVMEHAMGGLVFHGETRSGKSLAARVGVSVWGRAFPVEKAQPGQTLFHTLSTTDTSIDNLAAFSNGTLLVLDELGAASEKLRQDISQLIYRIASGQGRIRTERDGLNIKDGASWSGFCVVTSEHALKDVTTRKLPQGTNARFINVPFASQSDTVLEWHAAASALRDGLLENYGHAGPEFVKAVLALGTQGLNNALADAGKHICPDGAGGIRDTALGILAALLACGRIAHSAGVIGELTMRAIEGAVRGLWETFANEQGQSEHMRCDEMIQEYFNRHLGAFELLTQRGNKVFVGGAKGLRSQLPNGLTRFYLTDDQLCEAVGRVWDARAAARFLKKAGRLHQNNAPNLKSNLRAEKGEKVRQFYMIDIEIVEEGEFEELPS